MNPNSKRILPVVIVGAVVAGGVYMTRGGRLTGEAGMAGVDAHLAHLGQVDEQLLKQLDGLSQLPSHNTIDTKDKAEIERVRHVFSEAGVPALATLTTHFRDNGCFQPGSAAEVRTIVDIIRRPDVTPKQRRVVAYVLLDAAKHASRDLKFDVPKVKPFSSNPAMAKAVVGLVEGEDVSLPAPGPQIDPNAIIWDCTYGALQGVSLALQLGVVDASTLHIVALEGLGELPKGHPVSPGLVRVASLAANAAKKPASVHLDLVGRQDLSDEARAVACYGALDVSVDLSQLKTSIGANPPRPLAGCLVAAGDADAIRIAAQSKDYDLRVAALLKNPPPSDGAKVKVQLEAAGLPEISPRERAAYATKVALGASKCADPSSCLASVDEIAVKFPEAKLPERVAAALYAMNPKRPTLQAAPAGDESKLSAILGQIAKAEGTVLIAPSLSTTVKKAPATADIAAAEQADVASGLTIASHDDDSDCDFIIEAGVGQPSLDEAFENIERGVICAQPGHYTGPLVLSKPNIRFLAHRGGVKLQGPVVIEAPIALIGFEIEGPVAVAETARGAVLAQNTFGREGVSLTTEVTMAGNSIAEGRTFSAPGGVVPVAVAGNKLLLPGQADGKVRVSQEALDLAARWPPRI